MWVWSTVETASGALRNQRQLQIVNIFIFEPILRGIGVVSANFVPGTELSPGTKGTNGGQKGHTGTKGISGDFQGQPGTFRDNRGQIPRRRKIADTRKTRRRQTETNGDK
jgi:hypothetical protein